LKIKLGTQDKEGFELGTQGLRNEMKREKEGRDKINVLERKWHFGQYRSSGAVQLFENTGLRS
jgi:hypothetical protein